MTEKDLKGKDLFITECNISFGNAPGHHDKMDSVSLQRVAERMGDRSCWPALLSLKTVRLVDELKLMRAETEGTGSGVPRRGPSMLSFVGA